MGRKKRKTSANPTAYLDTSIFYSRYFGHPLQKTSIARAVGGRHRITSTYTFTEIKNFVCLLIDFYFVLDGQETLEDAMSVVANSWGRQPGHFLSVLSVIKRDLEVLGDKKRIMPMFRNHIHHYIELSEEFVQEIIDTGLECPLGLARFSDEPGLTPAEIFIRFRQEMRCQIQDPVRCNQDEFRSNNSEMIDLVRTDSRVSDQGARRTQRFLSRLAPYGGIPHARGLKDRCSKIGDLIIALQAPRNTKLFTLDGAFRDYMRLIGRECEVLPSLNALQRDAVI